MWYKNIADRFFGSVTKHACDRRTDGRTDRRTELRLPSIFESGTFRESGGRKPLTGVRIQSLGGESGAKLRLPSIFESGTFRESGGRKPLTGVRIQSLGGESGGKAPRT